MKWSIAGLILVGLIAGLSAMILVVAVRAGAFGSREEAGEVELVIAARDLQAMSVIKAEDVETKTVSKPEAPLQPLSNPVQVIGRVLSVPLTKGQAFTRKNFAAEGSGIILASALKNGMRAVSVSLSDYSGLYGLLYPGSVVDVLAYLKPPAESGRPGEAVSITLLRGVQVLGVEDHTVVSTEKDEDPKAPEGNRGSNKRWMVTLMVQPREAQALQLAMENGRISLAMRNPLDNTSPSDRKAISLAEIARGSIAQWSKGLDLGGLFGLGSPQAAGRQPRAGGAGPVPAVMPAEPAEPAQAHLWDMMIYRGSEAQIVHFPHPDQESSPSSSNEYRSEQP